MVIEVERSLDYTLRGTISSGTTEEPLQLTIIFKFTKEEIDSDILIRLVVDGRSNVELSVVISAQFGIDNISSKLDMRALILSPTCSLKFVPILEIDEKDVSVDHKSTIGRPDPSIVTYLQTRGLSATDCTQLLASAYLDG